MIGFLIGTACLIGLVKTVRHGRCGRGGCGYGGGYGRHGHCGGHGYGRWGGHGGWGDEGHGGYGPGRWMLRGLFQRLQTSPGQEKVILEAVETLRAQRATVKDVFRETRSDAAKGFRAEGFDEALMGAAFARQDEAITTIRKAAMDAFAKVHAALDERQRRDLADLIEQGPRGWSQGGHHEWHRDGNPYRY